MDCLERRQLYIPIHFKTGDPAFKGSALNHHSPAAYIPLKQGRDPRIIYDAGEAIQLPRIILYSLAKADLPASMRAPNNYSFLQGHTCMGVGLWPILTPHNSIPDKAMHIPHIWLSAHTICTPKSPQDDRNHGYCRVINLRKAKPYEVENLPYSVRLLYNASHFFEETIADLVTSMVQRPLDLILGSPAAPAILDILAVSNQYFAKHPRERNGPPCNIQDIADTLILEYVNTTLYPTVCSSEEDLVFLRGQISMARGLSLQRQVTFLCHAFDAAFSDNLNYCSKILKHPSSKDKNFIGIVLYPIDTLPSQAECIYQTSPHLIDMLIMAGLRFNIFKTNRTMRVCQAKKEKILNDSTLGRVYIAVALARDLTDFYTETHITEAKKVSAGDILLLPEINTANIPLPPPSDTDYYSDDMLEQRAPPVEASPLVMITYWLNGEDTAQYDSTANGIKTMVIIFSKRFASDAPVNDKYYGMNFRTFTPHRTPSPNELNDLLRLTPNTWVKPSSPAVVNDLLTIKLRLLTDAGQNLAATTLLAICDGLRQIKNVSYLFTTGPALLMVGPLSRDNCVELNQALRTSGMVDYLYFRRELMICDDRFALHLHRLLYPDRPIAKSTKVAVMGIKDDTPIATLRALAKELKAPWEQAFFAQNANDSRAMILLLPYDLDFKTYTFLTPGLKQHYLTDPSPYTVLGMPCDTTLSPPPSICPSTKDLAQILRQTVISPPARLSSPTVLTELYNLAMKSHNPKCCEMITCLAPPSEKCLKCDRWLCQLHSGIRCGHHCYITSCLSDAYAPCPQNECNNYLCPSHAALPCPHLAQTTQHTSGPATSPPINLNDDITPMETTGTPCAVIGCLTYTNLIPCVAGIATHLLCAPHSALRGDCLTGHTKRCSDKDCLRQASRLCDTCNNAYCLPHLTLGCPHSPCHQKLCRSSASTTCKKRIGNVLCGKHMCDLHASTICPGHVVFCSTPKCRQHATSLCANPSCAASFCSRHLRPYTPGTPCAHTTCELCVTIGKISCGLCNRLLCATHSNTPCPDHSVDSGCVIQDCNETYHAFCTVPSCQVRLCQKHFRLPCPHTIDGRSLTKDEISAHARGLKRNRHTATGPSRGDRHQKVRS